MPRTVLFFGDSATRGYGVGRERRYAALVAAELASRWNGQWTFEVEATASDFRTYRTRFATHLERVHPAVVVCQCPVGPACFFPRFPLWVRPLMAVRRRTFSWLKDRYIRNELRGDASGDRTYRDSLYEGHWLNRLHRWRPSRWPVVGPWWTARARQLPPIPKITSARYLERMRALVDDAQARGVRQVLVLGPIPVAEDICPGYFVRVAAWSLELRAAFDTPERGVRFLDLFAALRDIPSERLLLRDRIHPSPEGHREVARLLTPTLEPLLSLAAAVD